MVGKEHTGHRKRLDDKSNRMGFEFLEEHEQLEKLLYAVIPQGNTNPLAHRLIEQCGSLYGVLTADIEELMQVEGVGGRTAQFLHDLFPLLGCVERCMLREQGKERPVLRTTEQMGNYGKTLFYGKLNEAFYMVSLNKRFEVFRVDKLSEGNGDETPVYIREAVKQVLRTKASYVMIAHNHPSGNLHPSRADIDTTCALCRGLEAIGVSLLDHIIVGGGDYISMKELDMF